VALGFDVAPKDVDEALADSSHARAKAHLGPICRLAFRAVNKGLRVAPPSRGAQILQSWRSIEVEGTARGPTADVDGSW
jgi:hypothetical protein